MLIDTIERVWVYDGETWSPSTKYNSNNFPGFDYTIIDPSCGTWSYDEYNTGVKVTYKNTIYSFTEENSGLLSNKKN